MTRNGLICRKKNNQPTNLMILFCASIKRNSVSLFTFSLLNHVQVILCAKSAICHLKYPYGGSSSHFCFLYFVVLLFVLILYLLILPLLAAVNFSKALRVIFLFLISISFTSSNLKPFYHSFPPSFFNPFTNSLTLSFFHSVDEV